MKIETQGEQRFHLAYENSQNSCFLRNLDPFLSSPLVLFNFNFFDRHVKCARMTVSRQWLYCSACWSNTPRFNLVKKPFQAIPGICGGVPYPPFDHPDFRQYHSRINTLSASVMTSRVIFLCFLQTLLISSTPRRWCRTALSEASFPHPRATLCKWLRRPGWKSLPLFHFTRWKEPVKGSNDWAYSPSMVAAVGGPGKEDGYDTMIE